MTSLEQETKDMISELGLEGFSDFDAPKKAKKKKNKKKKERKKISLTKDTELSEANKKVDDSENRPVISKKGRKKNRSSKVPSKVTTSVVREPTVDIQWDKNVQYYPSHDGLEHWWSHYVIDPPPLPEFTISSHEDNSTFSNLLEKAQSIYKNEVRLFKNAQRKEGGDFASVYATSSRNASSLTFSDQLGHLVVLVQESPFHSLSPLNQLLEMCIKTNDDRYNNTNNNNNYQSKNYNTKGEEWMARRTMVEEVVGVFLELLGTCKLLPPHRALRAFSSQDRSLLSISSPTTLLLRYFEGELRRMLDIICGNILIPSATQDTVPHFMKACLSHISSLLTLTPIETRSITTNLKNPSQESEDQKKTTTMLVAYPHLLSVLVGKVGSHLSDLSYHASTLLLTLLNPSHNKRRRKKRNQDNEDEGEEEEELDEIPSSSSRDMLPLALGMVREMKGIISVPSTSILSKTKLVTCLSSLPISRLFAIHNSTIKKNPTMESLAKETCLEMISTFTSLLTTLNDASSISISISSSNSFKTSTMRNVEKRKRRRQVEKKDKRRRARMEKANLQHQLEQQQEEEDEEEDGGIENRNQPQMIEDQPTVPQTPKKMKNWSTSPLLAQILRGLNLVVGGWENYISKSTNNQNEDENWSNFLLPHLSHLFRLVHTAPSFHSSIQSLSLLSQLALRETNTNSKNETSTTSTVSSSKDLQDRFYRTLYAVLLSPHLIISPSSSPLSQLLNMIYSAMIQDRFMLRVCSFIHRLLLVAVHTPLSGLTAGILYLVSRAVYEMRQRGKGGILFNPMLEGMAKHKKLRIERKNKKRVNKEEEEEKEENKIGLKDVMFDLVARDPSYASTLPNNNDNMINNSSSSKQIMTRPIEEKQDEDEEEETSQKGMKGVIKDSLEMLFTHPNPSIRSFSKTLSSQLFIQEESSTSSNNETTNKKKKKKRRRSDTKEELDDGEEEEVRGENEVILFGGDPLVEFSFMRELDRFCSQKKVRRRDVSQTKREEEENNNTTLQFSVKDPFVELDGEDVMAKLWKERGGGELPSSSILESDSSSDDDFDFGDLEEGGSDKDEEEDMDEYASKLARELMATHGSGFDEEEDWDWMEEEA